jgi:cleavage stimulation factor subunit 2
MAGKYDVFVGNLTFNTTEEQLREKFSFVGPVKHVRILTDKESGKPKGFAFVEYFDSNTALSAIRHLDQTELNSRKIKVGYPAQSNLKDVARQIGQVHDSSTADLLNNSNNRVANVNMLPASSRQQIEKSAVNALRLHEAWDVLDAMKRLVAEDNNRGHKARAVLESHPQLIHALYEIQRKLGIPLPRHAQLSTFGAAEPIDVVNRNGSSMQNHHHSGGDTASAMHSAVNSSNMGPAQMASSRLGRNQQEDFYVTGNAQNDFSYNQTTNAQSGYLYHQSQTEYPFQSGNNQTDFPFQQSVNNQMDFPYHQSVNNQADFPYQSVNNQTDFPYQQSVNNQTDFPYQSVNNQMDFPYQQSVNNQTDFHFQNDNNQTDFPFQSVNDYPFQSGTHQNSDNYDVQGQFSLGQFGVPQQAQLEMGNYAPGTYDAMQGMQFQAIAAAPGVDASASMPSLQPYTSFDAPMSAGHQSYGSQQGSSERRSRFGGKAIPVGSLDDYNPHNMQQQQFGMQQGANNLRDGAQHHRL